MFLFFGSSKLQVLLFYFEKTKHISASHAPVISLNGPARKCPVRKSINPRKLLWDESRDSKKS